MKPPNSPKAQSAVRSSGMVRRRTCEFYVTEKIEAYNVAIEALQGHEPADGDPTGIARKLRCALAGKLDREIQKWCDENPPNVEVSQPANNRNQQSNA